MWNGSKSDKKMKILIFFAVTTALAVGVLQDVKAAETDTLHIPAVEVVSGLDDARSLVQRTNGELIITEAGKDRVATFRVEANDKTSGETNLDTLMPAVEQLYVPDLDEPDGLSLVVDTYAAIVSSGTGQVHLLDEHMDYMRSLLVPDWAPGGHSFHPGDVTSNEYGELFVLDAETHKIYHFNANGSYLQHFELHDMEQSGRFVYHNESLFVTDPGAGRVHVLTDNGRPLATIGTFPSLSRLRIIDDLIWVISGNVVHLFSMAGEHAGNVMPDPSIHEIRDVAGSDNQVFLLTSGSLYFWNLQR